MKPTIIIVAICVICTATLMSGCMDTAPEKTPVITPADGKCIIHLVENASVNIAPTEHVAYIDPLESLQCFLLNDSTSENGYVPGEYVCMDFSLDLASHLIGAGYDAGVVKKSAKYHTGSGHMLAWVTLPEPYGVMYVEPMLDEIYDPEVYTNCTEKDSYVFREVSIEIASRNRMEARQWG